MGEKVATYKVGNIEDVVLNGVGAVNDELAGLLLLALLDALAADAMVLTGRCRLCCRRAFRLESTPLTVVFRPDYEKHCCGRSRNHKQMKYAPKSTSPTKHFERNKLRYDHTFTDYQSQNVYKSVF